VRDDTARESFKTEIGRVGITLCVRSFLCWFVYLIATRTMFNSKGLEYDDVSPSFPSNSRPALTHRMCVYFVKVILYNFFEDSTLDNLWKYLTNEDQHKLKDSKYAPLIHEVSNSVRFQDVRRLTSWPSKLKCLYVAITRAKHRLWIVDYSNTCEPIMVRIL
jgi:ATP-dependent exoDNAse (exonuclease V) beta subunit